jgi:heme o synthase
MQLPASQHYAPTGAAAAPAARPVSRMRAAYGGLVVFACVLTYVVIAWGGFTRATGSGLACPDWPLCHGQLTPIPDRLVFIEWFHRLIASSLGFFILLVTAGAWKWFRHDKSVLIAATLATPLVIWQGALGALTVTRDLSPAIVSAHLGSAMLVFASLLVTAAGVQGWPRRATPALVGSFPLLATFGLMLTYGVMLTGTDVVGSGAGAACRSWPLCDGLPGAGELVQVQMFHRAAVLLVGVVLAGIVWQAWKLRESNRALWVTALVAGVLYLAQALIGAGNIWFGVVPPVQVAHVAAAAAMWATMVLLTTLAWRASRGGLAPADDDLGDGGTAAGAGGGGGSTITGSGRTGVATFSLVDTARAYISLTKPRIIELLLVTTVPAMVLAEQGMPPLWLIAVTVIGGALCAGGANAINCYIDRDIDEVMRRTQKRPLPRNVMRPRNALIFALALEVAGAALLATMATPLAAALAVGATLFYVFIYTLWLKRSSVQNIVIGGAAGAVPPLVGWAAVTGRVEWPAVVMFLIIFFWTPAHFWALAIKYRDDYARAGVPMAPVVWGNRRTHREILIYTVITIVTAFLLVPAGAVGVVYALGAALLGGAFLMYALRLRRQATVASAMKLFVYSIAYLFLLFGMMVVDQAVRNATGVAVA